MPSLPSPKTYAKGKSYAERGAVDELTPPRARTFGVLDYVVVIYDDDPSWCSCPATTKCSHIIAAEITMEADR